MKLEPCPFCGGEKFDTNYDGINPNNDWVTCETCGLCGNWGWHDGDIGWNFRPVEDKLHDLIKRLIAKLPNEKYDYSGVKWCAGCGAIKWVSGDDSPPDPCKPDCVLQEARLL